MTACPKQHITRDPAYKQAHKDMPCLIGVACEGDVALAHYSPGNLARGRKADDRWGFPLCAKHAREQPQGGQGMRNWFIEKFKEYPPILDDLMRAAGERFFERWRQ